MQVFSDRFVKFLVRRFCGLRVRELFGWWLFFGNCLLDFFVK